MKDTIEKELIDTKEAAQTLVDTRERLKVSRSRLNLKIKELRKIKDEVDAAIKEVSKSLAIHASDVKMDRENIQRERGLVIAEKVADYYDMSLYEVYRGGGHKVGSGKHGVARARRMISFLCQRYTSLTLNKIGHLVPDYKGWQHSNSSRHIDTMEEAVEFWHRKGKDPNQYIYDLIRIEKMLGNEPHYLHRKTFV
jgi:chromosomal replication initiation ATPase DnaA